MEYTIVWKCKSFSGLSKEELYQIVRTRLEVFVLEQNCSYQDCDNKDQKAIHLWGEIEGDFALYLRILPAGISYKEISIGRVLSTYKYR